MNGLILQSLKWNRWLVFCSLILLSYCFLSDLICICFIWLRVFHLLSDLIPPGACNLLNSSTIYANNEVSLAEVDIYGFDYDYTLALYSNALNTMIYNTARGFLIEHFKVCFTVGACIMLALKLLDSGHLSIFSSSTVSCRHSQIWLHSQLCRSGSSLWHPKGNFF